MKRNWLVDGVPLDDPDGRWNILLASPPSTPSKRQVARLELANRSNVFSKRQGWGEGQQRFRLVLRGDDVEANADVLMGVLARAENLVSRIGSRTRQAEVIEVTVAEPERVFVDYWLLEVVFSLQPFWSELGVVLSEVALIPGDVVFTEWAGTTGDVMDGILRVRGPLTRCSITSADGRGLSFEYELTDSQYAFIDPVTMTAWRGGSSQWTPSANLIPLDYPAGGTLVLSPGADGVALSVTAEGADSETSGLVLRGRKWWL